MNAPSSRKALRRLRILVFVVVGVVIYAYGWSVTQINLDRPQEALRQTNAGNALRELLSPNIFEQDYDIQNTTVPFLMNCPADGSGPVFDSVPEPAPDAPYIVVTPACASSDSIVTVQGYNFYPDSLARINWIPTDGERRIRQVVGTKEDNFITKDDGSFEVEIEVPRIRGTAGEVHSIEAQGRFPSGLPRVSDATFLVIEKMIETIFLALIATSLAILPAAGLSFFAAHNLMRSVRTTLGNLMLSFALLPVGWVLGTLLFGLIGTFAVNLGKGAYFGASTVGLVPVILFGAVTSARMRSPDAGVSGVRWRSMLNVIVVGAVFVFILGLVGGLGVLFGTLFQEGILGYLSNFVGSIGELIELLMPIISSLGGTLTVDVMKQIEGTMAHAVGGVLGVICGAILLGVVAGIAMQAAWLGLLVPISAGALTAPILPMLYDRLVPGPKSQARLTLKRALSWVGWIAAFVATFLIINLRRTLIEGTLPSQIADGSFLGLAVPPYVAEVMLIGAVVGGVAGLLAGTKAAFPVGEIMYNTTRTILTDVRVSADIDPYSFLEFKSNCPDETVDGTVYHSSA